MNIIFDLGGVVVTWAPVAVIGQYFPDKAVQEKVWKEFFKHDDWNDYDRGTLETEILIQRFIDRAGIEPEKIRSFLDAILASLKPIPETIKLLYKFKNEGQRLFCLSNINIRTLAYLKSAYTFWEVFSGCVFSCNVKMIKPEEGIYRYLLNQYKLNPHDCLFIDDLEANLKTAAVLGIKTHLCKNPANLEKEIGQILAGSSIY